MQSYAPVPTTAAAAAGVGRSGAADEVSSGPNGGRGQVPKSVWAVTLAILLLMSVWILSPGNGQQSASLKQPTTGSPATSPVRKEEDGCGSLRVAEKTLRDREEALEKQEKALLVREEAVKVKELSLQTRETALQAREEALSKANDDEKQVVKEDDTNTEESSKGVTALPLVSRPSDVPTTQAEAISRFRKNKKSYLEMYKAQLFFCGTLCDMSQVNWRDDQLDLANEEATAKYFADHFVSNQIDCGALFSKEAEEVLEAPPLEWPPPRDLPLADIYTFNGRAEKKDWFFENKYLGGRAKVPVWSLAMVRSFTDQLVSKKSLHGTYGSAVTNWVFDILKSAAEGLKDKSVLIIGSENPWLEVAVLAAGAKHVTTLEYGKIVSEDPRISTLRPFEFNEMYRNGTLPRFDAVVTFSSLEHSGLGRYGDGLNPWGDVISLAKASCVLKDKATLVVGVPIAAKDGLFYNAHREYGPNRWPIFLTNFRAKRLWIESGGYQHGIVLAQYESPPSSRR